jgi:hypothetical protein
MPTQWIDNDLNWPGERCDPATVEPDERLWSTNWLAAWAHHYLEDGNWSGPARWLMLSDSSDTARALLPLARQSLPGTRLKVLSLAGYHMPLRSAIAWPELSGDDYLALSDALKSAPGSAGVRLGPVHASNVFAQSLKAALVATGWRLFTLDISRNHSIATCGEFSDYKKTLSKKKLSKVNYYERKLAATGEISVLHCNGNEQDWTTVIRDLGKVESESWVNYRGEPRFVGETNQAFWCDWLSDPDARDICHVWLLYCNDKPVSFCFAIRCGDVLHVLANSYDESVAKYRTGSILYRDVVTFAHASSDIASIDLSTGDSGYKRSWRAEYSGDLEDWIAFPPTLAGRLLSLLLFTKQTLPKLKFWRQ